MAPVKIICGRAGTLWPQVLQGVQKTAGSGRRAVLLVPEQYTLQAEQDLIRDLKLQGLLDIDVMSPGRLRSRIREYAGHTGKRELNQRGRNMAVGRVLMSNEKELEYYGHAAFLPGTAHELALTIGELQEAGVVPDELEELARNTTRDGERAKCRDLARVWRAYTELISDQFEDEEIRQRDILARLIPSGVLKDTDVWIYGFESLRTYLAELVAVMAETAHEVTVTLVADRQEAPDGRMFAAQRSSVNYLQKLLRERNACAEILWLNEHAGDRDEALSYLERNLFSDVREAPFAGKVRSVSVYRGANPSAEAAAVVDALQSWHEQGMAWKDMVIAVPGESSLADTLAASMTLAEIPCYMSKKDPVSRHGLSRLLTGALRAVTEGYGSDAMIMVIRSGFSGLTAEEALLLEAYAVDCGIDHKKWRKPFTYGEKAEAAEIVRLKLIPSLELLHDELIRSATPGAFIEAIVRFLEREGAYNRLMEREEELLRRNMQAEAAANRQMWKSLMEMLDQLWALLGEKRASMREMTALIGDGLEQIAVSAVPSQADCVMIGEAGHMLTGRVEGLVCMGMQDGILSIAEAGVLSDRERGRLEESLGKTVGLNADLKVSLRKSDYYRTLTLPSRKLLLTCSLSGEDGKALMPASLLNDLHELFPALQEEGTVLENGLGGSVTNPDAAFEGLGLRLRSMRDGESEDLEPEWKTALRSLWKDPERHEMLMGLLKTIVPENEIESVSRELAGKLFMTDSISISRLENFAGCPYRHFVDHGLKPVRRKPFEFESNEKGSFYHEALDTYLKVAETQKTWPDLTPEEVDGIMDGILERLTEEWEGGPLREDSLGMWEGDDVTQQVRGAARVMTLYAQNSTFRTLYTEKAFGDPGGFPPLILHPKEGGRVALRGRIDRIDQFDGPEGKYIRVVDNKSSKKELNPAKVQSGEQLQLLLYLKAALNGMKNTQPAGALYFPVMDPYVETAVDEPQEAEKKRVSELRMKGVVLADPDVVEAMDRVNPYSIGKVFNTDGTVSKTAGWALDRGTMEGLMEAAEEKAGELCTEIRQGNIRVSPSGTKERNTCTYCEYRSICHRREDSLREADEKITFADVASEKKIRYNEHR